MATKKLKNIRSNKFTIRLTESERSKINKVAKKGKLTATEYARNLILQNS